MSCLAFSYRSLTACGSWELSVPGVSTPGDPAERLTRWTYRSDADVITLIDWPPFLSCLWPLSPGGDECEAPAVMLVMGLEVVPSEALPLGAQRAWEGLNSAAHFLSGYSTHLLGGCTSGFSFSKCGMWRRVPRAQGPEQSQCPAKSELPLTPRMPLSLGHQSLLPTPPAKRLAVINVQPRLTLHKPFPSRRLAFRRARSARFPEEETEAPRAEVSGPGEGPSVIGGHRAERRPRRKQTGASAGAGAHLRLELALVVRVPRAVEGRLRDGRMCCSMKKMPVQFRSSCGSVSTGVRWPTFLPRYPGSRSRRPP